MYKYIFFSNTHIKHMIYNIFISLKYISETEFCVIKYVCFYSLMSMDISNLINILIYFPLVDYFVFNYFY